MAFWPASLWPQLASRGVCVANIGAEGMSMQQWRPRRCLKPSPNPVHPLFFPMNFMPIIALLWYIRLTKFKLITRTLLKSSQQNYDFSEIATELAANSHDFFLYARYVHKGHVSTTTFPRERRVVIKLI